MTVVLAERDRVSGEDPDEEDGENVDEFRRRTRCYKCKLRAYVMGDFRVMSQGHEKGKAGKKGGGPNGWRWQGQCWRCGRTEHKENVDVASAMSVRRE